MGKRIAIIGAGISGLLACKYTMQKGFYPIVFEARHCIGGVWSNTMESTQLQTPKSYYQFSDFDWPESVSETFPDHKQVLEYINSFALHFDILSKIKFNSKVISIDLQMDTCRDVELWGGTSEAFSPTANKWNIIVSDVSLPLDPPKVYQVDFVILCIGKFSDLPNIPTSFPSRKGAEEVFHGKVLHSLEYSGLDKHQEAHLMKDKRVTVVGFQKSAIDIANRVAKINDEASGATHPCTLLFKTTHWTVSDKLVELTFLNLNRFSELMVHKPGEGFLLWLLAILLSPLLWIFGKATESYLKWIYPLRKYNMVPDHGFLRQIRSCMYTVLPSNFYDRVKDGSLRLKKSKNFSFCKNGLMIENDDAPLETDVVIFATGYQSDQKIANIFKSSHFKNCITGSSTPFYRECIHPQIPQLAILGYSESPAILYTTEMRAKWLAHFLQGNFRLPKISEMEENVRRWESCTRRHNRKNYKRGCVSVMLQIHCNDEICRDMNCNPRRKKNCFSEYFSPYSPMDYAQV